MIRITCSGKEDIGEAGGTGWVEEVTERKVKPTENNLMTIGEMKGGSRQNIKKLELSS